mgnify:FL=1
MWRSFAYVWENTIMAGGVGMAGMPYPPKCVLWEDTRGLVSAAVFINLYVIFGIAQVFLYLCKHKIILYGPI